MGRNRRSWIVLVSLMSLACAVPAHALCVGNLVDDFEDGSLGPLWTDASGGSGSGSETGGRLTLTKNNGIVGIALVRMAAEKRICGDFDIQVDYDLGTFPAPATGSGRFHTMILRDHGTDALLAGVERYRENANACIPFTNSYKFYTTNPGCTPTAIYVSTSDVSGKFRLVRQGTTVLGYYWDGSAWVESMNRSITAADVYLDFNSGTNGTLTTGHTAYFDNLQIESVPSAPVAHPTGLLALAAAIFAGGAMATRRRARSRVPSASARTSA